MYPSASRNLAESLTLCRMAFAAMTHLACVIDDVARRRTDPNRPPSGAHRPGSRNLPAFVCTVLTTATDLRGGGGTVGNCGGPCRHPETTKRRSSGNGLNNMFLINHLIPASPNNRDESPLERRPFTRRTGHAAPTGRNLRATQMGVIVGVAR